MSEFQARPTLKERQEREKKTDSTTQFNILFVSQVSSLTCFNWTLFISNRGRFEQKIVREASLENVKFEGIIKLCHNIIMAGNLS